jgi:hypothetical protein
MARMAAVVEHGFGSLMIDADGDQFGVVGMMFAEVGAKAALSVVKLQHVKILSKKSLTEHFIFSDTSKA